MIKFKNYILEDADKGLAAKAKKSGISLSILKKVYNRGMAAWKTGHRPGTTPQQWGMARVNSYITKGKGTYHGADKDLREAAISRVKNPAHASNFSGYSDFDGPKAKNDAKLTNAQMDAHGKTSEHHRDMAQMHTTAAKNATRSLIASRHSEAARYHEKAAERHYNASTEGGTHYDVNRAHHATEIANALSDEIRNKLQKKKMGQVKS